MTRAHEEGPSVDQPIYRSDDILGGAPVFAGTRVPVRTLLDYLEAGERLDDFLDDFPTVRREDALSVLELARQAILAEPSEPVAIG